MAGVVSAFGVTAMTVGLGGGSVCVTSGLFSLAGTGFVLGVIFGKGLMGCAFGLICSTGLGGSMLGLITSTGAGFLACTSSTFNTLGTFLVTSNLNVGITITSNICNKMEQIIAQMSLFSLIFEGLIEVSKA